LDEKKLLALLRGEKSHIVVRIGEEHDGCERVLRFYHAAGGLRLNVKDYEWDHGGKMY